MEDMKKTKVPKDGDRVNKDGEINAKRKRPERITRDMLGYNGTLAVPSHIKEAGFSYFWSVSDPNAIRDYETRGWEPVLHEDGSVYKSRSRGSEPMVLLKIPTELYDQIIELKQEMKHEYTKDLRSNPIRGSNPQGITNEIFTVKQVDINGE